MAILLKIDGEITMTYWPLVDGDLKRYIDQPNTIVEEQFPGEIDRILAEQAKEKISDDSL